jgi:aminopeptidase N
MQGKDESLDQYTDAVNASFGHGGGYSQVYYKMATLLYNLQYILGDSLFQHAMKHYFNQWKFCHPYFEDMRKSFSEYTHTDLDWFFDEWLETTKTIDYKVQHVKKLDNKDNYMIEFKRIGRSQMPIDFTVIAKDGKRYNYYVPNTWFQKATDATVLPKWYGWDKLHPTYKAYVIIPGGIKNVIIDTSGRLADINRLNNYEKTPVDVSFDSQISNYPDWDAYDLRWRPDVWYNNVDALKLGLHLDGNYMNYQRIFSLTAWLDIGNFITSASTKSDLGLALGNHEWASGIFSYQTPFKTFIKSTDWTLNASYVDGLITAKTGINIAANDYNKLSLDYQTLYRPYSYDLDYLPDPAWWNYGKFNTSMNLSYTHTYRYFKGNGTINFELRSSGLLSDYSYSYARISVVNKNKLGKLDVNTRTFIQYGTGSNWAPESELYLGGANPEELMGDKYTRSVGIPPFSITGPAFYNNFQEGGGLDVRGAGMGIAGSSGICENIEFEFDRLVKFTPRFTRNWLKLDTYIFADGATISGTNMGNDLNFPSLYADAGPGVAFTIKHFWVLEKVKPLTVRLDLPLLLYQSDINSTNIPKFRWVIGINRAF